MRMAQSCLNIHFVNAQKIIGLVRNVHRQSHVGTELEEMRIDTEEDATQ